MNITIYRAEALPKDFLHRPEYSYQLPSGFWFLVDDDAQVVIEPALLYLVNRFINHGKYKAALTHKATAYDLADWWRFLAEKQIAWSDADTAFLIEYRDTRVNQISYQTHEKLKAATVKRRMGNVIAFYKWAFSRRLFDLTTLDEEYLRKVPRSIDSDPLAHTRAVFSESVTSTLTPKSESNTGISVHTIHSERDWPLLRSELGPLPHEAVQNNDPRSSRDRLAAELSYSTGLRVDEVAKLTTLQILSLPVDPDALPHDTVTMTVTKTKRLVARNIFVPMYLVHELLHYIEHERKACMEAAKSHGMKRQHNTLFVNSLAARSHVGKPIHPDTFDRQFRAAVFRAGLVKAVEKTDPETGDHYITKDTRYTFHDLRHSFAITLYKALRKEVASPWLEVSQRLGHKSLKTTTDIYLAHLDEDRRDVNQQVFQATRSRWNGD